MDETTDYCSNVLSNTVEPEGWCLSDEVRSLVCSTALFLPTELQQDVRLRSRRLSQVAPLQWLEGPVTFILTSMIKSPKVTPPHDASRSRVPPLTVGARLCRSYNHRPAAREPRHVGVTLDDCYRIHHCLSCGRGWGMKGC